MPNAIGQIAYYIEVMYNHIGENVFQENIEF